MNFSKRTNWDLGENDWTLDVQRARLAGRELIDLTVSNPTTVGLRYDEELLLAPLAKAEAMRYEPAPFGMRHAREAVAKYYADHGAAVSTDNVCLTTSTSEAYSFLFRLLCDPGDEVLIATPSYPLFDFIARLDNVMLREYPLMYDGEWHIDLHGLEASINARTKAVVVVHPNNPTGNYASVQERAKLDELCARHGLALIVDEVFLDYALHSEPEQTFAKGSAKALTFVLSGISKVCALPQMKLSWIAASGLDAAVKIAKERLEVIADTFLSVNAPTQFALPSWLAKRGDMQQQIVERTQANLALLKTLVNGSQASLLSVQGGWTAVLRVPRHVNGLMFAEATLQCGAIVQPGEFYGLSEGHVVLSLLTEPGLWQRGLQGLPLR